MALEICIRQDSNAIPHIIEPQLQDTLLLIHEIELPSKNYRTVSGPSVLKRAVEQYFEDFFKMNENRGPESDIFCDILCLGEKKKKRNLLVS